MMISKERVIELGREILTEKELGMLVKRLPNEKFVYICTSSKIGHFIDISNLIDCIIFSNIEMDEEGMYFTHFINKKEYTFQIVRGKNNYCYCIVCKNNYSNYCKTFKELLFKCKHTIVKNLQIANDILLQSGFKVDMYNSYTPKNLFWLNIAIEDVGNNFTYLYNGYQSKFNNDDCYYDLVTVNYMGNNYAIPVPILAEWMGIDELTIYISLQYNLDDRDYVDFI